MHSLAAQPLAGAEEAANPFWSPDSRWIAFAAQGKLKKIEASGGPAQTLCDVRVFSGGAWNQDGVILYSELSQGLFRVPAQGGVPTQITTFDPTRGESRHRWPVFVPGGRHYLYTITSGNPNVTGVYLGTLDSKERVRLVGDNISAAYAPGPSGDGYLLFVREGTLRAQPLELTKRAVSGDAFPVAERVGLDEFGRGHFSVSATGMLVVDSIGGGQRQLLWMDRGGKRLGNVGEPGNVMFPALSPDEKHAAFGVPGDIWLQDLTRGISTRFTFHPGNDNWPVWSPDGSRIAFGSSREGGMDLYQKSASGAGQEQPLLQSANPKGPRKNNLAVVI